MTIQQDHGGIPCARCGHPRSEHGQERGFYEAGGSRIEVCLACPGWRLTDPPPRGSKARHRFLGDVRPEKR